MAQEPTKSRWLQEVEDDAIRIQNRRFNEYFDEQQYQKEKAEQKSFPERMAEAKAAKKGAK